MKEHKTLRKLMVIAGILAAFTIVLSPAFQQEAMRVMQEVKAPVDEAEQGTVVSTVSAEALTSSQAVQVESANPFIIQEILEEHKQPSPVFLPVELPVSVLTTLLRSTLSPQAP